MKQMIQVLTMIFGLLALPQGHPAPAPMTASALITKVKLRYATAQSYAEDSTEFSFTAGGKVSFSDQSQIRFERDKQMRFSAQKSNADGSSIHLDVYGSPVKPILARWDQDKDARYTNISVPTPVQGFSELTFWSNFSLGDPLGPPQQFTAKLLLGETPEIFDPARYGCMLEKEGLLRCASKQGAPTTARVWITVSNDTIEKIELTGSELASYYRFVQTKISANAADFATAFPADAARMAGWRAQYQVDGLSKEVKAAALAGDRLAANFVILSLESGYPKGVEESEWFALIERAQALQVPGAQFLYSRMLGKDFPAMLPPKLQKLSVTALRTLRKNALLAAASACDAHAINELLSDDEELNSHPEDAVDAKTVALFQQRLPICQAGSPPAAWIAMKRPIW